MNRSKKLMLYLARAVFLAVCIPIVAHAQSFPSKPIRLVVPFPPGGVDVTIRMIQARMSEDLGQPVVIDNRPGANGFIGTTAVARAAPDGYTLLATVGGTLVTGAVFAKTVPFDPIKDFMPITMITRSINVLVAKQSLPVESLKELIDYAKRNPGKLSYGHVGIGSAQHVDAEMFKLAAGVDIVSIPYKGFGPVAQALLGGEIDVAFITLQAIQPFLISGKVKALAVTDGKRYARLPNLPDLSETLPSFQKSPSWISILGPAGLPKPIAMRLHAAVMKAVNSPEVRSKLEETSVIVANTPEEFAARLKNELEQIVKVQKILGIKVE